MIIIFPTMHRELVRGWTIGRGRITASIAAKVAGLSPWHYNNKESNTKLARKILGLDPPDPVNDDMRYGSENEPRIRRWFVEKYLPSIGVRRTVTEVGLAVLAEPDGKEERIGASLDGELFESDGWGPWGSDNNPGRVSTEAVEIKAPRRMYRPLIERAKGLVPLPKPQDQIPIDHAVQIMLSGYITNKTHVWYVVAPRENPKKVYVEKIEVDRSWVIHEILPKLDRFWDTYIQPLLDEDALLKPTHIYLGRGVVEFRVRGGRGKGQ